MKHLETPAKFVERIHRTNARADLTELAAWLNRRYGLDLAKVATAGPRQGSDDQTPFLEIHRGTTPADVVVAVSLDRSSGHPTYLIAVFTSTAWFELGDPFVVLHELRLTDAAAQIARYLPYVPHL